MAESCILVATDFGSRTDRAIDRALLLGEQTDRTVRLVHALDYMDAENADRSDLDSRMRDCVGESRCKTEFAYPQGSPPTAIALASQAEEVDLLVLGPARYNSIGDFFLGTAVDYVLRHTQKPTLIVKQRARLAYRHIIAGTDFSPGSANAIVTAAKMFPDATVHVVHAWHVPFEGFQKDQYVAKEVEAAEQKLCDQFMESLAAQVPHLTSATARLVRGNAHKALASEFDAVCSNPSEGLVVLGSHGASGFRQAAIGSVTSDLLRSLTSDVLVVSAKGVAH